MNVRAEVIEAAFVDLLNRLTPKPERMAMIERIFRSSWTTRIRAASVESEAHRRELAKAKARKQRILNQLADGVLSAEDSGTMKDRVMGYKVVLHTENCAEYL